MIKTESIAGYEYLGRFQEILAVNRETIKNCLISEFGENYNKHSSLIPIGKINGVVKNIDNFVFAKDDCSYDLIDPTIKGILELNIEDIKLNHRDLLRRSAILLADAYAAICIKSLERWHWGVAMEYYGRSHFFLGVYVGYLNPSDARSFALRGVKKKLALDPKQHAKKEVRICWIKNKDKYKSKSAFARDMLSKYEVLESQRVIERWCKDWEAELCQQST